MQQRARVAPERLTELTAQLRDQPVVVVADLVADRFSSGWAQRISREAPVLILEQESITLVPGGGANAVANVRSLGGSPLPVGLIGEDEGGLELAKELECRGINTRGIARRAELTTPSKTRILGGRTANIRQQIVRVDAGDKVTLTPAEQSQLLGFVEEALDQTGGESPVVVFSDYGYGIATPELHEALLARRQVRTLVDSRYRLGDYSAVTAATPNQEEAESLAGVPLDDDSEVLRCGRTLRTSLGTETLLVTRGQRGMALVEEGGTALLPIYGTDEVVDVTGAGDTVIGTFSLALAAGASAIEAALLANYAGGIAVMKAGTATVSATDLVSAIQSDPDLPQRVQWKEA